MDGKNRVRCNIRVDVPGGGGVMELRSCPACGCKAIQHPANVSCTNIECRMYGPGDDCDGYKWNALPRHGDIAPSEPEHMPVRLQVAAMLFSRDTSTPPEWSIDLAAKLIAAEKASRK